MSRKRAVAANPSNLAIWPLKLAVSPEQKAFVLELFEGVGALSSRAMMGGMTFYSGGETFAILGSDEQIYIKAKGALAREMEEAGSTIFSMTRKDGSIASMGYWTLPDAALDDPDEACRWAQKALASPDR